MDSLRWTQTTSFCPTKVWSGPESEFTSVLLVQTNLNKVGVKNILKSHVTILKKDTITINYAISANMNTLKLDKLKARRAAIPGIRHSPNDK